MLSPCLTLYIVLIAIFCRLNRISPPSKHAKCVYCLNQRHLIQAKPPFNQSNQRHCSNSVKFAAKTTTTIAKASSISKVAHLLRLVSCVEMSIEETPNSHSTLSFVFAFTRICVADFWSIRDDPATAAIIIAPVGVVVV